MADDAGGGSVDAGLPAATDLGEVTLWVGDLDRQVDFYTHAIGLSVLSAEPHLPLNPGTPARSRVVLGQGQRALLVLEQRSDLTAAPPGSAGLFHTAFLFDSPAGLAAGLARALAHRPDSVTGSADHRVSEAFYLDDPEGNGVELYRDRPREQWTWQDGVVTMTVDPLDPAAYLVEHRWAGPAPAGPAPAIRMGHVHLRVGDIAMARDFTTRGLGFDVTFAMGGSALFVSAGGYHHHLGLNTWHSRGAGPRPVTLGLASLRLLLPDAASLRAAAQRLTRAGWAPQQGDGAVAVNDPWGTRFLLSVEPG